VIRDWSCALTDHVASLLLAQRHGSSHWEGRLSSSALSTATAIVALALLEEQSSVRRGAGWLIANQNPDGGWGDTPSSRSNISTTALAWAALSFAARDGASGAIDRAASWLRTAAGATTAAALRAAILRRYGKDKTFSVPILTVLALTGALGDHTRAAWRHVPQLPFELAAVPHRWFQHLQLPVVSYALPALIAIGQARHHFAPSRNPLTRALRARLVSRTHRLLRAMQPTSGGYLEATPLTSFVVMSLAASGRTDSPVVAHGARFLRESMRADGSWPIDTHLATWVTTLSVRALSTADAIARGDAAQIREWLLRQQTDCEHPFTHAAPGAWAWTPLSGGVPDADDTAGALVALSRLGAVDERSRRAALRGIAWLLDVQNRDGGIPTFCRGWGALPFDRSTPEITAHALEAWSGWEPSLDPALRARVAEATRRALAFLERAQRADGSWVPLWFGNEHASGDENPTYGTARVLIGLSACERVGAAGPAPDRCRRHGIAWLLAAQNADGGWGGDRAVPSSIEETGVALTALCECDAGGDAAARAAASRGARWLTDATAPGREMPAAPIGLYFAKLWYYEELYPLIFAVSGLAAYQRSQLAALPASDRQRVD
jgi:squalene-hopene/tetraprenyl-beta-curcumene cyclase